MLTRLIYRKYKLICLVIKANISVNCLHILTASYFFLFKQVVFSLEEACLWNLTNFFFVQSNIKQKKYV